MKKPQDFQFLSLVITIYIRQVSEASVGTKFYKTIAVPTSMYASERNSKHGNEIPQKHCKLYIIR
jgi:hypothetical protein